MTNKDQKKIILLEIRLDYQPLFGKGARAPPPERHERAAEIKPNSK